MLLGSGAFPLALISAPILDVGKPGSDAGQRPLGPFMDIREDASAALTLNEIVHPGSEASWVLNTTETPNPGFSSSAFWIRVHLANTSDEARPFLLEHAFPLYDYLDLYLVQAGEVTKVYQAGDRRPFGLRPIWHRNFLFPVTVPARSGLTLYFRFAAHDGLHEPIPLTLWEESAFDAKEAVELFLLGAYVGIILIMALYNLFIFFSVRDSAYLYYVLYLLFFIFWFLTYKGFAHKYFWPDDPWMVNFAIVLGSAGLLTAFVQFTRIFLNTRKLFSRGDWLLKSLIFIFAGLLLYGTVGKYSVTFAVLIPCVLVLAIPAATTAAVVTYRRGHQPARFYLTAFLLLFLGSALLYLKIFSVLPSNVFTENALLLGSAAEVVLLSFGLANRINVERKEKVEAQRLALQHELAARKAQETAILNLEKGNLAKDQFLANLSHELRTPLSVIYGYAEMLEFTSDPLALKGYGKDIYLHAGKLATIVDDLMLIADLEADLELKIEEVDLPAMLRETRAQLADALSDRGLQLHENTGTGLTLRADARLLQRALLCIMRNACDYNRPGGEIRISAEREANMVRITVGDSGTGIALEHLEKIFDRFYRVDTSTNYAVSGVGLGLFLARRIVELHSGSITARSAGPGSGSEFTVLIPAISSLQIRPE